MIPALIDLSCSMAAANGKTGAQLDEELAALNRWRAYRAAASDVFRLLSFDEFKEPLPPARHWSDKYKHPKERISQRQFRRWATQGTECRTQY